jgi:hypothetical protein
VVSYIECWILKSPAISVGALCLYCSNTCRPDPISIAPIGVLYIFQNSIGESLPFRATSSRSWHRFATGWQGARPLSLYI